MLRIKFLIHVISLIACGSTPVHYHDDKLAALRKDHLAALASERAPSHSSVEAERQQDGLVNRYRGIRDSGEQTKSGGPGNGQSKVFQTNGKDANTGLKDLEGDSTEAIRPYLEKASREEDTKNAPNKNLKSKLPYSDYELVLARWKEDISWLSQVPAFWRVTIYNKGGEESPVPLVQNRSFTVINRPNQGRESESYMFHIISRWDSLAEYTVFGQAWPFLHSPHFVDLLSHPELLKPVQCLSLVYLSTGHPDNVTPKEVVETYRKHEWYRSERMSLRTLDSIYFNDMGAAYLGKQYLQLHQLDPGTNIISHHLDVIGLEGWVPHEEEIGSFAYGGHFGVDREHILQHPRHVYENFRASTILTDLHTYVAERMFLILFGGIRFKD